MAYSWVGTIDHIQHVFYGGIDPKSSYYDPAEAPRIMDYIRRVYSEVDARIGRILEHVDMDRHARVPRLGPRVLEHRVEPVPQAPPGPGRPAFLRAGHPDRRR